MLPPGLEHGTAFLALGEDLTQIPLEKAKRLAGQDQNLLLSLPASSRPVMCKSHLAEDVAAKGTGQNSN